MKMTKAMYNINPSYKEMIIAHKREVKNHQNLINKFEELENVYRLEKERNIDHQRGHIEMIKKYKELL